MNIKIKFSTLLLILLLSLSGYTQEVNFDRHAISAKVLGIDYGTPNDVELDQTFGLEVVYRYMLMKNFGVAIPLKIGVANVEGDRQNRNITSLDGLIHFFPAGTTNRLNPYLLGGIGYVLENLDNGNVQIPLGLGFNYMMGKNSFLTLQGEYRSSAAEARNNLQLGLGYLYQFGQVDTDGDGILDGNDECPEIFGTPKTNGCPDTDNDGIANKDDACPTAAGSVATNGCPDTDNDGVIDTEDACPEEAGLAALQGCPDTDGDGVANAADLCPTVAGSPEMAGCPDTDGDGLHDGVDNCPTEAGLAANNGCPGSDRDEDGVLDEDDQCPDQAGTAATQGCPDTDGDGVRDADDRCPKIAGPYSGCPDTDGDGIMDADDRCPEEAGLTTNKGCPEIEESVKDVLSLAMRAVQFETGSAIIKPESYSILDQIADIMKRYPAYQLRIAGHTDNVGDAKKNQELSEARAAACYEYLLSKGSKASKMTFDGFGEDYPIAPNSSASGRTLNRRVEFDLIIQ
ncbi:MAG: OmpA family protein [Bacteroidetes bacterium]|nr:MAG: OmpA family protein [Bacteroidota bacterium]PTM14314.1 MAG: OmpA family protein [Bacteroidota bacterium]